jgi:serine protease Do
LYTLKTMGGPGRRHLRAGALAATTAAFAKGAPADVADLAATVTPAVVNISVARKVDRVEMMSGAPNMRFPEGSPFEEFFKRFFRDGNPGFGAPQRRAPETGRATAVGSGFIIDAKGYVVTNNHVVDGADTIKVTLTEEESYPATIVGRDEKTDLALLKVEAGKPLPYVAFGDSDNVRSGDWIMAVGNPFGLGGSVTAGIVSARGRDLAGSSLVDFLQIDAAINSGNSGGPSFDADGKVIGINTAIYSPNGGNVGIGFAIPSNLARQVVADLRNDGKVSRGWLGVQIQPVTDELAEAFGLKDAKGALVSSIVPGAPAASSGVKEGDVILEWDGKPVEKFKDLPRLVASSPVGEAVKMTVWRDRTRTSLSVKVGALPSAETMAAEESRGGSDGATEVPGTGLTVADLTPATRHRYELADDAKGVVITDVDGDGPAARQGLRRGHVISGVGLESVDDVKDVLASVERLRKTGQAVITFKVTGEQGERFVALRVAPA